MTTRFDRMKKILGILDGLYKARAKLADIGIVDPTLDWKIRMFMNALRVIEGKCRE